MINWKKYVNIHIEPQRPLRFKHKCIEVITIVSKKIKYPLPLKISHCITKRFNTIKQHDIEYRNLHTPNIHQIEKMILHSEQSLPKTHKLPRAKQSFLGKVTLISQAISFLIKRNHLFLKYLLTDDILIESYL